MATISYTNIKVKLGALQPWDKNPRKIVKEQAARLLKSFEKFGQAEAIVIGPRMKNGKYPLYNGHQRATVLMAHYGKDYKVDARRMSRPLTNKERQQLTLYLHSGATGEFDWKIVTTWNKKYLLEWGGMNKELVNGWKAGIAAVEDVIESNEPEVVDAEPQIDRSEELLKKWKVKTGDLWQIGKHRILCGSSADSENWARLCGDELATLTWTDPPYGVNYGEKLEAANPIAHRVRQIQNDDMTSEELEPFIRSVLINCSNHSVKGASIYVASPAGTPLPTLIASFVGSGFDFRWHLVWVKDQIVLSRADYHFKHENILFGWKGDGAHYFIDDRKQSSVFEYPRPKKSDEHPTMKPVELVMHMINNSSRVGEIVLEPFAGSGSTLLACQNLGRKGRGIEISPAYCSVILERMTTAFPDLEIKRIE